VDGAFFNKTGMLVEFPQLCHYERFALYLSKGDTIDPSLVSAGLS
jgi:hypothetical protein